MTQISIVVVDGERRIPLQLDASATISLFEHLRARHGLEIEGPCGGQGRCGKCLVALTRRDGAQERVLACRYQLDAARDEGLAVELSPEQAMAINLDLGLIDLAGELPDPAWRYVVAVDIGTTTVVALLIALDGERRILARARARNAQRRFGADVLTRIAASRAEGLATLVEPLRAQLAALSAELIAGANASHGLALTTAEIDGYAVAGNTIMLHYLAGLDPTTIGEAPFTPLSYFGEDLSAAALQLPAREGAEAWLLPAISGYIGGDVTGGLVAAELDRAQALALYIDIGTNGEMALGDASGLVCCSTAAGPAFEGAAIEMGLAGVAGAIARVSLRPEDEAGWPLRCEAIPGAPVHGICGSGLVDAIACLLELELIDDTGRLVDPDEAPPRAAQLLTTRAALRGQAAALSRASRGEGADDEAVVLLQAEPQVYLSGRDIREIQLAKAAIAAGAETLLDAAGIALERVAWLQLAGGFGSVVAPHSAARIGLVPRALAGRVASLGNSALQGAVSALVDREARQACWPSRPRRATLNCRAIRVSWSATSSRCSSEGRRTHRGRNETGHTRTPEATAGQLPHPTPGSDAAAADHVLLRLSGDRL